MATASNTAFTDLKFPEQDSELLVVLELKFASTGADFYDYEQELKHVWHKQHEPDIKREHWAT